MANNQEHPDPQKHKILSFIKSCIRIMGSLIACVFLKTGNLEGAIMSGAILYGVAEIVGIVEELV